MIYVLRNAWALLAGMLLLMLGNGLQGTLLAVRGGIEGFSAETMSLIMTGYFVGFLIGSRMAPRLIRRVGHVRAFAALASLISAAFILYPVAPDPFAWTLLRIIVGICFSGVYVVAESWLNEMSTNETRGQALSAYLITQMVGIIAAQAILTLADPSGYTLFVIISVLVSLSFAPILLSVSAAPVFETSKPMSLKELYHASPLGCVGTLILGGVFSALFGMSAVYGTSVGLTVTDISVFVSMIYIGGLLLQYPMGYLSDHMDRRLLIALLTGIGGVFVILFTGFADNYYVLMSLAFVMGGVSNPLYSLLIAYTNDYLEAEDMPAASAGLLFLNGVGAMAGPVSVGWLMGNAGPNSFFLFIAVLFLSVSAYAAYRMTRRPAIHVDATVSYVPVAPQSSGVVMEVTQGFVIDRAEDEADRDKDGGEATH